MVAQTATRKKGGEVYRYGWYRCGFARDKGPAVCAHAVWYRRDRLEGALLAKFREALTPEMIERLTRDVNVQLATAFQRQHARASERTAERSRLEREAAHLVRFLAAGGDSRLVREALRTIETQLELLRAEAQLIEKASAGPPPRVHPGWVAATLERLDQLVRQDPTRAKVEILKHLEGDLRIMPRPSVAGERRAEISGRARSHSLLEEKPQEAVCLQVVAGAGFEPATFGL
jgi:hypothetical protein